MKRIVHKMAVRDIDQFHKEKGTHEVQLCIAYAQYIAKKPILSVFWHSVTCADCIMGRWQGVPDGMNLKLKLVK